MRAYWRAVTAVFDTLVGPSFGSPGYRAARHLWDDPDLSSSRVGRVFLVTGANSGIGYATASGLARRGTTVHMLSRNARRGEQARATLVAESGNRDIHLHVADMSSLADVERFAADFLERCPRLDGLVHNAGAMMDELTHTDEGVEMTFATGVLGPHLLTRLLRPLLRKTPPGRVVFVSSGRVYAQRAELEGLVEGREPFDGPLTFARVKRAQVLLAKRWAEELAAERTLVNAMHPGWVDTPGVARSMPRFYRRTRHLLRTPDQGADTILWLLLSKRAGTASGGFYFDRKPRRAHPPLGRQRHQRQLREALWETCERLTTSR